MLLIAGKFSNLFINIFLRMKKICPKWPKIDLQQQQIYEKSPLAAILNFLSGQKLVGFIFIDLFSLLKSFKALLQIFFQYTKNKNFGIFSKSF